MKGDFMKKILFIFVLGCCLCVPALMAEKNFSLGVAYDIMWHKQNKSEREIYAIGGYIDYIGFFGDLPFGLWENMSIHGTDTIYFNKQKINVYRGITTNGLSGLAFRIDGTEKLKIITAIGLNYSMIFTATIPSEDETVDGSEEVKDINDYLDKYNPLLLAFGIGGNININYKLTDRFLLKAGANVVYAFIPLFPADNFFMLRVIPHIGVTFVY